MPSIISRAITLSESESEPGTEVLTLWYSSVQYKYLYFRVTMTASYRPNPAFGYLLILVQLASAHFFLHNSLHIFCTPWQTSLILFMSSTDMIRMPTLTTPSSSSALGNPALL